MNAFWKMMFGHATQTPRMNIWCLNCWSYTAQNALQPRFETYTQKMSAPEDISEVYEAPPRQPKKTYEDFGESVWLRLEQGRDDGLSPGQVVPMLCKAGDITKPISGRSAFRAITVHRTARPQCGWVFQIRWPRRPCRGRVGQTTSEALNIPPADRTVTERPRGRSTWDARVEIKFPPLGMPPKNNAQIGANPRIAPSIRKSGISRQNQNVPGFARRWSHL